MNNAEFSTEFDVLYNNVTSNQAPGLNEYEKSVFLTKAQSQLLLEYFNPKTDGVGGGFDGSVKRQYDFSSLVDTATLVNINGTSAIVPDSEKLDRRSHVFLFPKDFFLAVNEIISDSKWQYSVLPLNYSEYQKLMLKPYNFPVKRAAWRILNGTKSVNTTNTETVEFITPYNNLTLNVTLRTTGYTAPEGEETVTTDDIWFHIDPKDITSPMAMLAVDLEVEEPPVAATCDLMIAVDSPIDYTDSEYVKIIHTGLMQAMKLGAPNSHLVQTAQMLNCVSNLKVMTLKAMTTDEIDFTTTPSSLTSSMAEVIGKFEGEVLYKLRYVKTPSPIILDDLTNYGDASIQGISEATECKMPPETHQEILERAVTLAKIAWQGGTITQAAAKQKG